LSKQSEKVRDSVMQKMKIVNEKGISDKPWVVYFGERGSNSFNTKKAANEWMQNVTGMDLYQSMDTYRGPQGASEMMATIGIPGIKYLDASSRGKARKVGEFEYTVTAPGYESKTFPTKLLADAELKQIKDKHPDAKVEKVESGLTYNYVIFDDKLVNIVETMYQSAPKGSTIQDARKAISDLLKEKPDLQVQWRGQWVKASDVLAQAQDAVAQAKDDAKLFKIAAKCLGG